MSYWWLKSFRHRSLEARPYLSLDWEWRMMDVVAMSSVMYDLWFYSNPTRQSPLPTTQVPESKTLYNIYSSHCWGCELQLWHFWVLLPARWTNWMTILTMMVCWHWRGQAWGQAAITAMMKLLLWLEDQCRWWFLGKDHWYQNYAELLSCYYYY